MYKSYGPPGGAPTVSPDFDTQPNADAGKSSMYTPSHKDMYNKGRGSMQAYAPTRPSSTNGAMDPMQPQRQRQSNPPK